MSSVMVGEEAQEQPGLEVLAQFQKPNLKKAVGQLLDTFIPLIVLWAIMVRILNTGQSLWWLIPGDIAISVLLVRSFIFFHDAGHGSFFASKLANKILGLVCGVLICTPLDLWTTEHRYHHQWAQHFGHRGVGDIWTLTVEEYCAAPLKTRILYRIFRNPFFLFGIAPWFKFIILQRFPPKGGTKEQIKSVIFTDIALAVVIGSMCLTVGWRTFLLIQLPAMSIASAVGLWLFYLQHQFEDTYWADEGEWSPKRAALEGSSLYDLPGWLHWMTGNIGIHNIHHLKPRIPNYYLLVAYASVKELLTPKRLTIWKSFTDCLFAHLWCKKQQRMISFREIAHSRALPDPVDEAA